MKIKTEVTLEFIKPDGTREPYGPPVCNDISWQSLRAWFLNTSTSTRSWALGTKRDSTTQNTVGPRWYLYYGSRDCVQTFINGAYQMDAQVTVDTDTPIWTAPATSNDPALVTFTAVIPAPVGSPRTIKVIGLDNDYVGGNATIYGFATQKFSLLRLTTPCVQTVNMALAITYRLYLYPAVSPSNPRSPTRLWEDVISAFQALCTATESVSLSFNTTNPFIVGSPYRFDTLQTCAYSCPKPTSSQPPELASMELCDTGVGSRNTVGFTCYTNAMSTTVTHNTTDTYAKGAFIKTMLNVGGGLLSSTDDYVRRVFWYDDAVPGLTSPLQNIFAQRNAPPGPFQDLTVSNTATMSGSVNLDASTWSDPGYQVLAKINIAASGDAGISTYTLETFMFISGFAGNRWMPRTAFLPQKLTDASYIRKEATEAVYEQYPYNMAGGVSYRSPDGFRYVMAADCTRTQAGISVYDIFVGSKKNFNAATTPALPVTAVADGEVAKGYIFVACANTGLWRINPALDTVEQITSPTGTNKAYQIAVKDDAANTLWVLFDGGLCKLANPDAAVGSMTWTVYNTTVGSPLFSIVGITDNNWASVASMVINPTSADNQFLFVTAAFPDTSDGYRKAYVWWNTAGAGAAYPATNGLPLQSFTWSLANLLRQADAIVCVGDQWLLPMSSSVCVYPQELYRCSFGAASLSDTYFKYLHPRGYPAKINGQRGVLVGGSMYEDGGTALFIKDSVISTIPNTTTLTSASSYVGFALRNGSTNAITNVETVNNIPVGMMTRPLVYLPSSNMIFSHEQPGGGNDCYGVTPFMLPPTHAKYATYKGAFWKKYGWDGSNWVLGSTSGRPTHAAAQQISVLNNMSLSFTNGGSGTSFVANEWFITVIGLGISKDNGTSYTYRMTTTFDACAKLTISGNVPQTPLGLRTDEPVTFMPTSPNVTSNNDLAPSYTCCQNKGVMVARTSDFSDSGPNVNLIADQLIPASTDFDFRFKWISFAGSTADAYYKSMGLATGSGTYTYGLHFRYNANTGNLEVYNNTTLVNTISNPSVDAVCRIARVGSTITAYYDGVSQGTVSSSSKFVIMSRSGGGNNYESGWWDMKLTYTESRRVLIVGSSGAGTGYYSSKFAGLISNSVTGSNQIYIGSGSPLTAIMDYTTAGVALTGTGRVKVAAGAGWLIFHDSEPANPITGYAHATYVRNNL